MHTKAKGAIGELSIAKDLRSQGYFVFTELGDLSKTDLIIESEEDGTLFKVQCKYVALDKTGCVMLSKHKSGPNYRFTYTPKDFDILAIYCPEIDRIAYINSSIFETNTTITLRVTEALGNGSSKSKYFSDYTDIYNAISGQYGNSKVAFCVADYERKIVDRNKKIVWPSISELQDRLDSISYAALARELGVTGNAIRNHIKKHNTD